MDNLAVLVEAIDALSEMAQVLGYEFKNSASYRANVRAAFRGYWNGTLDFFDFFDMLDNAIRRGFTQAWYEGAASCGISPEELTPAERLELQSQIVNETSYINGAAVFVEQNSKANGGKLSAVFVRANFWAQGYDRVMNLAKTMACKDQKLVWTLHPAEHCASCKKLSGKVKRASYWESQNVYPKAWDKLDCRQNCKCSLEPTELPLTRGPLPRLP